MSHNTVFVFFSGSISHVITNVTAHPTRWIDLVVGIGYNNDSATVKTLLQSIVSEETRILPDSVPQIAVAELGESSINLVVRPWVKTADYWAVRFGLIKRI